MSVNLVSLYVPQNFKVSREQFAGLANLNRNLRLERTAMGELTIMPPSGGNAGQYCAKLLAQFVNWNEKTGLGVVFDSSTVFQLPNGSQRSTNIAWISLDRWNFLSPEQQESFPPLCPDFVLELRTGNDSMSLLREKMEEYVSNQLRLGWSIDLANQEVEIYRRDGTINIINQPIALSGEMVLPGFELNLQFLWR